MNIFKKIIYILIIAVSSGMITTGSRAQYNSEIVPQFDFDNPEYQQSMNTILNIVRNCRGDSVCISSYSGYVSEDALPILSVFSQSSSPKDALTFAKALGNCESDLSCVAQTAGIMPRDAATIIKIYRHCGGDAMCIAESSGMIPQEAMVAVNIISNCGSDVACVATSTGLVPKNAAPVVNAIFKCNAEPTCMATSLGFVPKQGAIIANIIGRCRGEPICIAASSGLVPQDGAIVAQIASNCGGEPICIASQWGSVELQRCSRGIGVSGGCFGPNGEIMKTLNRSLPQHLHPDVILKNAASDLVHGPGKNNEIRKLARRLFKR